MTAKEAYEKLQLFDNKTKIQNECYQYKGDFIFVADVPKGTIAVPMFRVRKDGTARDFSMAVILSENGMKDFQESMKNPIKFR